MGLDMLESGSIGWDGMGLDGCWMVWGGFSWNEIGVLGGWVPS